MHTIDATNKTLGRLATHIAHILQGKHTPAYNPRNAGTDQVIVTNASKIKVSGGKETKKIYYRHTGYMGHLREKSYEQKFATHPDEVLRMAVKRMLPQNFLLQKRLNRLTIEK